ncbi:hypothetical protein LZ31DRAFT_183506 [Colletotrichum somersetense]|nr:hypothetical protein LZ31DRAFT_183506 [Colletotrichum somersetense]
MKIAYRAISGRRLGRGESARPGPLQWLPSLMPYPWWEMVRLRHPETRKLMLNSKLIWPNRWTSSVVCGLVIGPVLRDQGGAFASIASPMFASSLDGELHQFDSFSVLSGFLTPVLDPQSYLLPCQGPADKVPGRDRRCPHATFSLLHIANLDQGTLPRRRGIATWTNAPILPQARPLYWFAPNSKMSSHPSLLTWEWRWCVTA